MQTQLVVDHGAVARLRELFFHPKAQIQKEAVWAVSNIAAGNQTQIQVHTVQNCFETQKKKHVFMTLIFALFSSFLFAWLETSIDVQVFRCGIIVRKLVK